MTISSNESTVFNTYKNGYLWSWDYSYVNNGVSPSNDVSNYSTIYMYVFMENKGKLYTRDSASASYRISNNYGEELIFHRRQILNYLVHQALVTFYLTYPI